MVSQTLASAILNQKAPDIVGSFREGQEFARGERVKRLSGEALQAGGGQKLQELIGLDPEVGYNLAEAIGARSAKELNNFIRDASITENFFKQGNFGQGRQFIQQSLDTIKMAGGSGKIQQNLLDIYDNEGPEAAFNNITAFTSVLGASKEQTSGNQNRDRLLADLESDNPDVVKSARVALEIEEGAGNLTSRERILTDEELSRLSVQLDRDSAAAGETGKLSVQQELKPGVEAAVTKAVEDTKLSSEVIKSSFAGIGKARKSIGNIDRAIKAIDDGAKTGAIQSLFPSITTASIELDQLRNELGLDVIGSVTFGALSAGELNLALATALPTKLEGPALRDFLVRKKDAQSKVITNMNEAIQFLSKGNTVAEFIASKQGNESQAGGIKAIEDMTDAELEAELNQ